MWWTAGLAAPLTVSLATGLRFYPDIFVIIRRVRIRVLLDRNKRLSEDLESDGS